MLGTTLSKNMQNLPVLVQVLDVVFSRSNTTKDSILSSFWFELRYGLLVSRLKQSVIWNVRQCRVVSNKNYSCLYIITQARVML